jgi:hypothetical protein
VGYGLNHLLVKSPDSHKILVIEPNAELLLACLGQTDYRPFFANKKLHFLAPNEEHLNEYIRHLDLQYVYGKNLPARRTSPGRQWARSTPAGPRRVKKPAWRTSSVEMVHPTLGRQDVMVGNELKNFPPRQADGSSVPLK